VATASSTQVRDLRQTPLYYQGGGEGSRDNQEPTRLLRYRFFASFAQSKMPQSSKHQAQKLMISISTSQGKNMVTMPKIMKWSWTSVSSSEMTFSSCNFFRNTETLEERDSEEGQSNECFPIKSQRFQSNPPFTLLLHWFT
jgi:hypothetical protein